MRRRVRDISGIAQALAAVHTADFVGVLELLPEALCLIEYRKLGTLSPQCACAASDVAGGGAATAARGGASGVVGAVAGGSSGAEGAAAAGKRVAHVMNSRRQRASKKVSVRDAAPSTLRALDEVLSVDLRVYRAAVLRVLCDLRALERATGRSDAFAEDETTLPHCLSQMLNTLVLPNARRDTHAHI